MSAASSAPAAPGQLGVAANPKDLLAYLDAMESWCAQRRGELDRLDAAAQGMPHPGDYTQDIIVAFSLWQAIRTRIDELLVAWDSGRADVVGRERMSGLIWGRLDTHAGAATLSMVEAAALLDAITGQLRAQLEYDPHSASLMARIRTLRAGIVRCEDLAVLPDPGVPASARSAASAVVGQGAVAGHAPDTVAGLRRRLETLASQAERGGDITGPLGELEVQAARTERDLIVAATRQRESRRVARAAQVTVAALGDREPALRALAARCRTEIANPPKLAIPRVAALGEVPADPEQLAAYTTKLRAVARALDTVESAYSRPLRERAQLRYRLAQAQAKAEANGRLASPTVAAGAAEATQAVEATPCDLPTARFAVEQVEYLVRDLPDWVRGTR